MDVERGVNPNCSELIIRLNSHDMYNVKDILKAADIEEVVAKNFFHHYKEIGDWDEDPVSHDIIKTSDLNPKVKELMGMLKSGDLGTKYDEIYDELKELGFDDFHDSIVLADGKLQPDFEHGSSVSIGIADDTYHNGVIISGHQHCQAQIFPILKEISDMFGADVEAFDGGGSEMYEAWVNDGCPDIDDWSYNE